MRHCVRGWMLIGLTILTHSHTGHAEQSNATLMVGAEVIVGGCTASSQSFEGGMPWLHCAPSATIGYHGAVLSTFGGIAGPDDTEGTRVIVAY